MKKVIPSMFAIATMLFTGISASAENHPIGVVLQAQSNQTAPAPKVHGAGLVVTGISVGLNNFAPCYNCAGPGSVAIPYELTAVTNGAGIISTIQLQPTVYVGFPTINYSLVQGGKVLSSSSVTFPFLVYPPYQDLAYFPDTVSGVTGDAEIKFEVLDGTTLLSKHTYKIYIE